MRVGCRKEREKKITQAVKTTPHIKQGKGAALVRGTIILLHQENKKNINRDREGCRLDLKPSPDES